MNFSRLLQVSAVIIILFLLLAWIAGWFVSKTGPGVVETDAVWPADELYTVSRSAIPITYEALGTVASRTEVVIAARIAGTIAQLRVDEGDRVAAGQLIATLSAPEYTAATEAAQGQLEAARAALAQSHRDLERYRQLYERQIINTQQLEQMETAVEVAEAQLEAARGNASQAGTMVSYTSIHAPSRGVVAAKYRESGDVVNPGQPIIAIHDARGLRMEAAVDEKIAADLQIGDTVSLTVDAVGMTVPSRVEEIVPLVDQSSRTFIVKAPLPAQSELQPGMFGRLLLARGSRDAVLVPRSAVQRHGALDMVRVFRDGSAPIRYVRTGEEHGDMIEILSGLNEDEQVVLGHE